MLKGLRGIIPVFILLAGILFLLYYVQGSILGFFLAAGKLSVGIEGVGENGYIATVSNIGETDIETVSIFVTLPENSNITNPVDSSVEGLKLYWGLERLGAGEKRTMNFTAEVVGKIRVEAEGVGLIEKTEQFTVGREFDSGYYNVSLAGIEKPVSVSFKIKTVSIETTTSAGVETTTTEETTTTGETTSTALPPTTVLLGTNATGNETADSTALNTTNTTTVNITTTLQTTTSTGETTSTTVENEEKGEKKEKKEKQGGTGNLLADSPGTVWIDLDWEEGNETLVFDGIEGAAVYELGENTTELRVLFRPREGFKQVLEYYKIIHLVKGKVRAEVNIEIEKKEKTWTKGRELEAEDWFAREISDLTEKSVDLNYSAIETGFVDSRGLLLKVDAPITFYGKVYQGQNVPVQLDFYFKTENPSDCQIIDTGIEVLFENGEGDTTYILGINANKTLSIEPLLDPDFSGKIEDADFGWQHISATTRKAVPAGRLYRPFARPGSIGCLSGFESAVVSGFTVK